MKILHENLLGFLSIQKNGNLDIPCYNHRCPQERAGFQEERIVHLCWKIEKNIAEIQLSPVTMETTVKRREKKEDCLSTNIFGCHHS